MARSFFKPPVLSKAARRTLRRQLKDLSKARDRHRCRWPRADHPDGICRGPLESAHRVAIGMGGDPTGTRTSTAELLTTCFEIHQGPHGLERHGRLWVPLTDAGADGPIAFYRVVGRDAFMNPITIEIARERAVGVLDTMR